MKLNIEVLKWDLQSFEVLTIIYNDIYAWIF